MRKQQAFYGWTLLAVLFSLDFVNMGFPVYGGTVINSYMLRQIPMSRSTLGLGFTFSNLFVGLSATIVATSILKRGVRKTFAIGSALICAGSLFLAFFGIEALAISAGYGVIVGVGMGFGTLVPGGDGRDAVVQAISRQSDGNLPGRFGNRGICRRAAAQ